jgi:anti-sigma factor RsiW
MTHDEIAELLGAYALDAVDDDERAAVEAHLEVCPRCRAEVEEHTEVAGLLAQGGGPAPEGVWGRIADSLEEPPPELRLAPVARAAEAPPTADRAPGPGVAPGAGADVVRLDDRRRWPRRLAAVAAVAAAVLVAVLGLEVRDQADRIDELQVALDDPARAALDAALVQPDTRRVELAVADGTATIEGAVTADGVGYLRADALPDLGEGRTYQLWGLGGDAPVSLGTIGADPAVVTFRAEGWEQFAVSAEDAGGSVAPTSDPVAVGGPV